MALAHAAVRLIRKSVGGFNPNISQKERTYITMPTAALNKVREQLNPPDMGADDSELSEAALLNRNAKDVLFRHHVDPGDRQVIELIYGGEVAEEMARILKSVGEANEVKVEHGKASFPVQLPVLVEVRKSLGAPLEKTEMEKPEMEKPAGKGKKKGGGGGKPWRGDDDHDFRTRQRW